MALINFILLAVLWITKKPGGVAGWASLFPDKLVDTSFSHFKLRSLD